MKDAPNTEFCINCQLPVDRVFTAPEIHMNEMAGKDQFGNEYRRTNEPPDNLKPDTYHESLRKDLDNWKIVSTRTKTRRAGTVERPK